MIVQLICYITLALNAFMFYPTAIEDPHNKTDCAVQFCDPVKTCLILYECRYILMNIIELLKFIHGIKGKYRCQDILFPK